MWVLFGFFLLSQLDGLGAVGTGFVEVCVCVFKTYSPLPTLAPGNLSRMSLALLVCIQSAKIPGCVCGGGGVEGRVNCAPESEADRVSLVMLLSPWRWLEGRGGGGVRIFWVGWGLMQHHD